MNTYIKTLLSEIGDQIFPRTRIDAVYLLDNTTKLDAELDARDERIADPKSTPVDGDFTGIRDSSDANKLKKITWAQIKVALKSYFDTQYNNYTLPTASTTTLGGVKVDGTTVTITDGVISADSVDTTSLGTTISGATVKATPVDADSLGLSDSAASNVIKKLTWANLKASLKSYFDTLYNMYTHPTGDGNLHVPANSTTNNNRILKANGTAGSYSWTDIGVVANGLTAKATPVDADSIMIVDSAASNVGKKTTFTQIKAFLKTYFDGIYGTSNVTVSNYTATLPSASWTGSSAPYTKSVTVTGIVATDEPIVEIIPSGVYETDVTMRNNWALVYDGITSTNTITFYADSVPTADISLSIKVIK